GAVAGSVGLGGLCAARRGGSLLLRLIVGELPLQGAQLRLLLLQLLLQRVRVGRRTCVSARLRKGRAIADQQRDAECGAADHCAVRSNDCLHGLSLPIAAGTVRSPIAILQRRQLQVGIRLVAVWSASVTSR